MKKRKRRFRLRARPGRGEKGGKGAANEKRSEKKGRCNFFAF